MAKQEEKIVWQDLFPKQKQREELVVRVRSRILGRSAREDQKGFNVGLERERKVLDALQHLKEKGEIRDYLQAERLSYADLILGIDFFFIYVDSVYRICSFSVTGPKWLPKHQERHPEIPCFAFEVNDSSKVIEEKIRAVKDNDHTFN